MRLAPFLALALAGCPAPYLRRAADCPAGFVPVEIRGTDYQGRALSSRGVVIGLRQRANDEEGSLDYWTDVVKQDLTLGQGYAFRSTREVARGRGLLFSAPRRRTDAYYLALFVTPSRITTVEVAGPAAEVERDLPAIDAFLAKLPVE